MRIIRGYIHREILFGRYGLKVTGILTLNQNGTTSHCYRVYSSSSSHPNENNKLKNKNYKIISHTNNTNATNISDYNTINNNNNSNNNTNNNITATGGTATTSTITTNHIVNIGNETNFSDEIFTIRKLFHDKQDLSLIIVRLAELKKSVTSEKYQEALLYIGPLFHEQLIEIPHNHFAKLVVLLVELEISLPSSKEFMNRVSKVLHKKGKYSLEDKYRIIFGNVPNVDLHISKLREPLTLEEREKLLNYYPARVFFSIIKYVYLPLKDTKKIDEYMKLYCQHIHYNPIEFKTFEVLLNTHLGNFSFLPDFEAEIKLENILKLHSKYDRSYVFYKENEKDKYHFCVIKKYLLNNNSLEILYNYITLFYPSSKQIFDQIGFSSIYRKSKELEQLVEKLGLEKFIIKDKIPYEAFTFFCNHLINSASTEKCKDLYTNLTTTMKKDHHNVHIYNGLSNILYIRSITTDKELFNHFKSQKNELKYMSAATHEAISLDAIDYYSNDASVGFINFIKLNSSNYEGPNFVSKEAMVKIDKTFKLESEKLFISKTLISKNYRLEDPFSLFKWLKLDNPESIVLREEILTGNCSDIVANDLSIQRITTILDLFDQKFLEEFLYQLILKPNKFELIKSFLDLFPYSKCSPYGFMLRIRIQPLQLKNKDSITEDIQYLSTFLIENKIPEKFKAGVYLEYAEKLCQSHHFEKAAKLIFILIPNSKEIFEELGLECFNNAEKQNIGNFEVDKSLIIEEKVNLSLRFLYSYFRILFGQESKLRQKLLFSFNRFLQLPKAGKRGGMYRKRIILNFYISIIENNYNPLLLFKLSQILKQHADYNEYFKIDYNEVLSKALRVPKLLAKFSKPDSLLNGKDFFVAFFDYMKDSGKQFEIVPTNLDIIFHHLTKEEDKWSVLNSLLKCTATIPYSLEIENFIFEQLKKDHLTVFKNFGVFRYNQDSGFSLKNIKLTTLNPNYFGTFFSFFAESDPKTNLKTFSPKTYLELMKISLNQLKCSDLSFDKGMNLYNIISQLWDGNLSFQNIKKQGNFENDFKSLIEESEQIFNNEKYKLRPTWKTSFIKKFLKCNLKYNLKSILLYFYIALPDYRESLEKIGFFNLIDFKDEKILLLIEKHKNDDFIVNTGIPKSYNEIESIIKIVFMKPISEDGISDEELLYKYQLSTNIMNCDEYPKSSQMVIVRSALNLFSGYKTGKQNYEIMSRFCKNEKYGNYFKSIFITSGDQFLISACQTDPKTIKKIYDDIRVVREIWRPDLKTYEFLIKNLIENEENEIAQEVYLLYVNDYAYHYNSVIDPIVKSMSWKRISNTKPSTDINATKFNVKLYDYDTLDKEMDDKK